MWYVILLAVCIGGDQLLKWWVTSHLDVGQSAPLLPGIVRLTRLHNTGAAWSSFSGKTGLLAAVTIVLMAAVVYLVVKKIVRHPLGLTAAMLVLGGGAGNMIDRLCRGYVVDMFDLEFMSYPIFNLADIFIVVAGITLCLHVIFYRGDGSEEGEPAPKKARKSRQHPGAPARAHKLHLPARKQQPAAPKKPAAQPVSPAPAKDDPFAAWDRAPVQAQPVTPAAPSAPKKAPAAPAAPKPVQETPKAAAPAVKPADTAPDDPLLAYLNSTPAAPAEPEVADSDKEKDTAPADGEHYSLDDILAEFSDF